ncbi:hypothetical protein FQN50_004028 [Emmonsiellopsis sp. PD_5]|nr:hypothetical protein FQN50_004028 [Emmonsiellopsis sp. PD_5]
MSKRPFEGEQEMRPNPTRIPSDASRFNDMLLKKMQKALNKDPEANLMVLFPSNYASRLAEKKRKTSDELNELNDPSPTGTHCQSLPNDNRRAVMHVYPLSPSVSKLLETFGSSSQDSANSGDDFAQRLDMFLQASESVWVSEACANHRVGITLSTQACYTSRNIIQKFQLPGQEAFWKLEEQLTSL